MANIEKTPTTTAYCWSCGRLNPTHVLPEVRLMVCPNPACKELLPGESEAEYILRRAQHNLSTVRVRSNA